MAELHSEEAFSNKDADYQASLLARTSKPNPLAFDANDPMDLTHRPGAHINAALAGGEPSSGVPNIPELSMEPPVSEPFPPMEGGMGNSRAGVLGNRNTRPTMPTKHPEVYLMPDDSMKKNPTYVAEDTKETRVEVDPRELPFMAQIAMNERDAMAAELTAKKARVAFQEQYITALHHRQTVTDGVVAALNQRLTEAGAAVDLASVVAEVEAKVNAAGK